jgi:hypothetical protein
MERRELESRRRRADALKLISRLRNGQRISKSHLGFVLRMSTGSQEILEKLQELCRLNSVVAEQVKDLGGLPKAQRLYYPAKKRSSPKGPTTFEKLWGSRPYRI